MAVQKRQQLVARPASLATAAELNFQAKLVAYLIFLIKEEIFYRLISLRSLETDHNIDPFQWERPWWRRCVKNEVVENESWASDEWVTSHSTRAAKSWCLLWRHSFRIMLIILFIWCRIDHGMCTGKRNGRSGPTAGTRNARSSIQSSRCERTCPGECIFGCHWWPGVEYHHVCSHQWHVSVSFTWWNQHWK